MRYPVFKDSTVNLFYDRRVSFFSIPLDFSWKRDNSNREPVREPSFLNPFGIPLASIISELLNNEWELIMKKVFGLTYNNIEGLMLHLMILCPCAIGIGVVLGGILTDLIRPIIYSL